MSGSQLTSRFRSHARNLRDSFRFHTNPPDWDDILTEDLPFGHQGSQYFQTLIENSRNYLEFGSGSSTFAVAQVGTPFTTVESDARFLEAVHRRCASLPKPPSDSATHFLHGDIGRTGPWGKPIFPSIARPDTWRRYPLAPWLQLGDTYRADAILIDGRFRVACALAVILHQRDTEWTMVVDDYEGRPEYRPIADYAAFSGLHGRMAVFRPASTFSVSDAQVAFDRFVSDWR